LTNSRHRLPLRQYVDARGTGLVLEVSGTEPQAPKGAARSSRSAPLRQRAGHDHASQSSPALRLTTAEDQCAELKFMRVKGSTRVSAADVKAGCRAHSKVDTLHATLDRFIDQYSRQRNADGSLKLSSGYRADTERYLRAFERLSARPATLPQLSAADLRILISLLAPDCCKIERTRRSAHFSRGAPTTRSRSLTNRQLSVSGNRGATRASGTDVSMKRSRSQFVGVRRWQCRRLFRNCTEAKGQYAALLSSKQTLTD
jgi:hypothetical protein